MFLVDGASVWAYDKDKTESLQLESYDYFIGKNQEKGYKITNKDYIITRPYCRWFDKYPVPYLIKRGVYHNYKIIDAIKKKQFELLEQIIPYLLLVKKGSEQLSINQAKTYSDAELEELKNRYEDLYRKINSIESTGYTSRAPIRATNFDESLEHLVPNIESMFKTELFEQAERNILSGLGYIDVIQGVSSTRRESTLNPKAFMREVNAGVEGFKEVLRQLLVHIKKQNESHIKHMNSNLYICSAPIKDFMSPDFETAIRQLYDRGGISKRTYTELIGGCDFDTEIFRREREARSGVEYVMYPPIIQNNEDKGIDLVGKTPEEQTKDDVPADKKGIEKKNYENSSVEEIDENEEYVYDSSLEIEEEKVMDEAEEVELIRSYAPRVTEQYIRLRQESPKDFDKKTFRTVTISPKKGIKAIVGKKPGSTKTEVQSYLFKKIKWDIKGAKRWEKEHSSTYGMLLSKRELITAPYTKLTELPKNVQEWPIEKQRAWKSIFNNVYRSTLAKTGNAKTAETMAFRVAYSKIKTINFNKSFLEKICAYFTPSTDSEYDNLEEASYVQKEEQEALKADIKEKQRIVLDRLIKNSEND